MIVVRKFSDLKRILNRWRGKKIGFVPTMGDLHEGHLSLIRRSKKENEKTLLSIFVNLAQFDRKDDFKKYIRAEKTDLRKAKSEKVDLVFIPYAEEMYPENFRTWVEVKELSGPLCGKYRPGHFKGMSTIVLKLFNLVRPRVGYFGMKDFQQCKIVEQMVRDLNLPVKIAPCPIVREKDGLALSSRNRRLSPTERIRAARICFALQSIAHLIKSQRKVSKKLLERVFKNKLRLENKDKIEYLEIVDPNDLTTVKQFQIPILIATAVWIGKTRLIDNILVKD